MAMACEQLPAGPAAAMAEALAARIPVLETARLILRAPRMQDFAIYADIAASDRSAGIGGPMTRDEAWYDFTSMVAHWLLAGTGYWTVTRRPDGPALGFVGIAMEPGDAEPELGYMLSDQAEGHGYAAEAVSAARDFGFGTLGARTLVSYVLAGNTRSVALAERLGAFADGTLSYKDDLEPFVIYRHPRPQEV